MPFAGSRDRGASVWNSYVQGAQLKLAKKDQAEMAKLREAHLELQQHEQAYREERNNEEFFQRDKARWQQQSQFEAGLALDTSREQRYQGQDKREQSAFEAQTAERERGLGEQKAMANMAKFGFDVLVKDNPELGPVAKGAADILSDPTLSDNARGLGFLKAQQTLQAHAKELNKGKTKARINEAKRRGKLGTEDGAPDEQNALFYQGLEAGLDDESVSPSQADKALNDRLIEISDDEAYVKARGKDAVDLETTWMASGLNGTALQEGLSRISKYRRGMRQHDKGGNEYTYEEVTADLERIKHPQVKNDPEQARMEARYKAAANAFSADPSLDTKELNTRLDEVYGKVGAHGGAQQPGAGTLAPQDDAKAQAMAKAKAEGMTYEQFQASQNGAQQPPPPPPQGKTLQTRSALEGFDQAAAKKKGDDFEAQAVANQKRRSLKAEAKPTERVTTAYGSEEREKKPKVESDGFASGVTKFSRDMTKAEVARFNVLRESGSAEARAEFLASIKAKYGK